MKNTKTSARREPLTRTDEDTLRRIAAQERMFMRFSKEQRLQIRRLTYAGGFSTSGGDSTCDETIATLAEAALYVLGLDPLAEDAYTRLAEVVFGANSSADDGIGEVVGNEIRAAAETWTKAQRDAEREAALKARAA